MKFNRKVIAILAITSGLAVCTPVCAKEFKAQDSVITIEAPDKEWDEAKVQDAAMVLTDGKNKIIVQHYSNGEQLPAITVADSNYAKTCQNIISTTDEVFIITGLAEKQDSFQEIQKSVQSIVINKYGTKKAVKVSSGKSDGTSSKSEGSSGSAKETASGGESGVETASFTGWVKGTQVNVRSDCTVNSDILGQVYLEDPVSVTGYVTSGKDGGSWYQINYNGQKGYVAEEYISHSPSTAEQRNIELTDECLTIYYVNGNGAADIYKSTDGKWYDGSGREYSTDGSGVWTLIADGTTWTEETQESPADSAKEEVVVEDEDGYNSMTLYGDGWGSWKNIAGGGYTDNGDGTWTGPDGTVWYEVG